jgi:hypothetical protein
VVKEREQGDFSAENTKHKDFCTNTGLSNNLTTCSQGFIQLFQMKSTTRVLIWIHDDTGESTSTKEWTQFVSQEQFQYQSLPMQI